MNIVYKFIGSQTSHSIYTSHNVMLVIKLPANFLSECYTGHRLINSQWRLCKFIVIKEKVQFRIPFQLL